MSKTKTYYVIRSGWNAANQSSAGGVRNPRDQFESRQHALVAVVQAAGKEDALAQVKDKVTVYDGQSLFAVTDPRSVKGLTREVREFMG